MAFASAALFGTVVAMSRSVYDAGGSGLTLATLRACLTVLLFGLYFLIWRKSARLPRPLWALVFVNGLLVAGFYYGNVGSVEFVSVGMAVLIFFTYPLLIALASAVMGTEKLSVWTAVALVAAFAGLAIMLGVSFQEADWRGIALASLASICSAANAILVARRFTHVDPVAATVHMSIIAAIALIALSIGAGEFRLPAVGPGALAAVAVAMVQSLGMPIYYASMTRTGAVLSGAIFNIQPAISIAVAWLLYGEALTPVQMAGGALVLAAVWGLQMGRLISRWRQAADQGPA
jgi:drug/metabolite transporter (DMT)-like permease